MQPHFLPELQRHGQPAFTPTQSTAIPEVERFTANAEQQVRPLAAPPRASIPAECLLAPQDAQELMAILLDSLDDELVAKCAARLSDSAPEASGFVIFNLGTRAHPFLRSIQPSLVPRVNPSLRTPFAGLLATTTSCIHCKQTVRQGSATCRPA